MFVLQPLGDAACVEEVLDVARKGSDLGILVELRHANDTLVVALKNLGIVYHLGETLQQVLGLRLFFALRFSSPGVLPAYARPQTNKETETTAQDGCVEQSG